MRDRLRERRRPDLRARCCRGAAPQARDSALSGEAARREPGGGGRGDRDDPAGDRAALAVPVAQLVRRGGREGAVLFDVQNHRARRVHSVWRSPVSRLWKAGLRQLVVN